MHLIATSIQFSALGFSPPPAVLGKVLSLMADFVAKLKFTVFTNNIGFGNPAKNSRSSQMPNFINNTIRKNMKNIGLFFALTVVSCNLNSTNPNVRSSITVDSKDERIAVLKKEVLTPTEIYDTEYHLVNANGFTDQRTVPGASSLIYSFVVKVGTNDINKWTTGLREVPNSTLTFNWMTKLPEHRKKNWQTDSVSTFYTDDNNSITVVAYKRKGIIFKRISSN